MVSSAREIGILGTGSFLPGDPIPTNQVETVLGPITSRLEYQYSKLCAKFHARSGLAFRHFAIDPVTRRQTETNASMSEKAIRKALESADIDADSIDLLVVSTPVSDYQCPPLSALLQDRLGIQRCAEIEIHSNCSGTPKAIQIALDMLRAGRYTRAVVAYSQLSSIFLRSEYFNPACVQLDSLALRWIMSDGAAAIVLDSKQGDLTLVDAYVESIGGTDKPGMFGFSQAAFGYESPNALAASLPAIYAAGCHHVRQDAAAVNNRAPKALVEGLGRMLRTASIPAESITYFLLGIPGKHFITSDVRDFFRTTIGVEPVSSIVPSIEDIGYCGGATVLVQLDRLVRAGSLCEGNVVAAYVIESSKWMSGGFVLRAS
jgi:3-oxoacyl-[acyl-carrier-protein] synthase III